MVGRGSELGSSLYSQALALRREDLGSPLSPQGAIGRHRPRSKNLSCASSKKSYLSNRGRPALGALLARSMFRL